jgi:imidazoleglycerol-phosphate dehydratase
LPPLGVKINKSTAKKASVRHTTAESKISVEVSMTPKQIDVATGYQFLNHMIESIARWGDLSITIEAEVKRALSHLVAEDSGITLGVALHQVSKSRIETVGMKSIGFALVPLDEALSEAILSIEGRSNAFIERTCRGSRSEKVEDIFSKDLVAFLEGLTQGWGATLHIRLLKGVDPHHSWESAFRALGVAIASSLEEHPNRKGEIPGVKSYFGV